MPEGSSVRSPGSWQGGSWVSALLGGVFCWTSSQDLALWFCVSSLFHAQDLLVRRQFMLQSIGAVMSSPLCGLLVCFVFLGSVWFFVLLFLLLLLREGLHDFGLSGPCFTFEPPKRDTVYAFA